MVSSIDPYKGLAQIYEEIRPSYPSELIRDVVEKAGIGKDARLLEIGAGTGKATVQFAEKGFHIHAIELGEDMARILREKCASYPHVTLDIVPFEKWEVPRKQRYDLIYAAQAFHWLDAGTKYQKCHDLLKDGGWLALFWYHPGDAEIPKTRLIEEEISAILARYAAPDSPREEVSRRYTYTASPLRDEKREEIESSGLFEFMEKITYTDETSNSASQYLKVKKSIPAFTAILNSLEDHMVEKVEREIEDVIMAHGGEVRTRFEFSLYLARKSDLP
jgi:trans-aconitate methyltransferase